MKPVKIGLIGSGAISYIYLKTLTKQGFYITEVVGCSDLIPERSKARAEIFGIRQMTNDEILNDPEIEIVLNTTQNAKHHGVSKIILEAGKHVYSEKAMDTNLKDATLLYNLAKEKNLLFGAAPDCYMGSAYQTARKLIDDGWIGTPLFANAYCYRGYNAHERSSEPDNPDFGAYGTTMCYDMSGYYLNVLINLLGPVRRVSGYSRFFDDRVYTNAEHPNYKSPIKKFDGPNISIGCLEFYNGCYASLTLTQDGMGPEIPGVEIFGTHGRLQLPDPNCFGGYHNKVYLTRIGQREPMEMPFSHAFSDTDWREPTLSGKGEPCHNSWRGIAVVDMAYAIRRGRKPRSDAELALHAVEIADAIDVSSNTNKTIELKTKPERPEPLRPGCFGNSKEYGIDT